MITDVSLWFASNNVGSYTTIFEIDNENKDEEFLCPVCCSKVIPKGIKEDSLVSAHFAHMDASKCTAESIIHWCYKNNFLLKDTHFQIINREDNKAIDYICDKIYIEKQQKKNGLIYKPDVTVITTTGETIFFEMNYKNKKRVENYINTWLEFNCTVVEVDIKTLLQLNNDKNVFEFKPIFHNGKCYGKVSIKKKAYDNILNLKQKVYQKRSNIAKDFVNRLDWFWRDIANYKMNNIGIDTLCYSLDYLLSNTDEEDKDLIFDIVEKFKCNNVLEDYEEYKENIITSYLDELFANKGIPKWYTYNIYADYNNPHVTISGKQSYSIYQNFNLYNSTTDELILNIKSYMNDNYENVYDNYIDLNGRYKYSKYLGEDTIYLSIAYLNHVNSNQSEFWRKLDRYDFIKAIDRIKNVKLKIEQYILEMNQSMKENKDKTISKLNKCLEYSNSEIDKEISNILYPISCVIKDSNNRNTYIVLNPDFTKNSNGRTERWLINDFIDILHSIGIYNIVNHKI